MQKHWLPHWLISVQIVSKASLYANSKFVEAKRWYPPIGKFLTTGGLADDAAQALLAIKEGAVDEFRAALKKSKGDSKLRQNSLHGLAQLSDKSSTPEFIKALSDKDEDTRLLGLWGLSQVADPKTLEPFLADKKETGYARNQSAHLGFKFAEKLSKKDASKGL